MALIGKKDPKRYRRIFRYGMKMILFHSIVPIVINFIKKIQDKIIFGEGGTGGRRRIGVLKKKLIFI